MEHTPAVSFDRELVEPVAPLPASHLRVVPALPALRALRAPLAPPPRFVRPLPPCAAPRGLFSSLWLRFFGPPELELPARFGDFGAFRALAEVGSDYLPSSGTWPSAQKP